MLTVFKLKNTQNNKYLANTQYLQPGGTQIWVAQACAARASKPIPIFKGDFGQKGYPFLRISLQK